MRKEMLLLPISFIVTLPSFAQNVRLSRDVSGGYISVYTMATGIPYTDAVLSECSIARGRQNGKHFLYFAATHAKAGAGDETGMYVGSTDGREPVLLLHLPVSGLFAGGRFFFLRGTTLMEQAFDTRRLRLTGERRTVASGVGYDLGVWRGTFSVADNGVLVYSGGDPSSHYLQWFGTNGQPEKA